MNFGLKNTSGWKPPGKKCQVSSKPILFCGTMKVWQTTGKRKEHSTLEKWCSNLYWPKGPKQRTWDHKIQWVLYTRLLTLLTGAKSLISLDVCSGCWPLQLPRHKVHWTQGQEQAISQLIHKDVAFVRGTQRVISVNICSGGRSARIFEYSATFDFRFSISEPQIS